MSTEPDSYDIATDRRNYLNGLEKAYYLRLRQGITVRGKVYACEDADRAAFDHLDNVLWRANQKGEPWEHIPVRTLNKEQVIIAGTDWEDWLDAYSNAFLAIYQVRGAVIDQILGAETKEELDSINLNPF